MIVEEPAARLREEPRGVGLLKLQGHLATDEANRVAVDKYSTVRQPCSPARYAPAFRRRARHVFIQVLLYRELPVDTPVDQLLHSLRRDVHLGEQLVAPDSVRRVQRRAM